MIITCEKCDTRFKLDDSRIPADGVKVRCSRCKHAFRVARPVPEGASDADVADALAREAVAPESADDRTQTLGAADEHPDLEDHTQVLDHGAADLGGAGRSADEPEEESDWEFNEDPAEVESAAPPEPPAAPPIEVATGPAPPQERVGAPPPPDPMSEFLADDPGAARDPNEDSLADLGSPEDWDLLGDDAGPAPAEPPPGDAPGAEAALATPVETGVEIEARGEAEVGGEDEVAEEAPSEDVAAAPVERPPETAVPEVRLDVGPPSLAARAAQAAAWSAVVVLVLVVSWASLRPAPPASLPLTVTELGALQAADVRAALVENAVAGPLLVVHGTVRNPQSGPRLPAGALRVQLVDASGAALGGAEAWLGPAPPEAELREQSPRALQGAQAAAAQTLARTPLAPGESLAVAAVFAAVPAEARGFRLEVVQGLSPEASPPSPLPASE